MLFLGIDASLNSSGLVLYNEEYVQYKLIKPNRKFKEGKRLSYIYSEIKDLIESVHIHLGVMEGPAYNATTKAFSMGEAYGVFKLACAQENIPLVIASPTQLKKYFTGASGASKYRMIIAARREGYTGDSDDLADALGCAMLAKDIHNNSNHMNRRSALEVVHTLRTKMHTQRTTA